MALAGWIKLHRALSDHYIASNPDTLSVWIHLLLQANHAETKRQINGQVVVLAPGQLITSRKSISEKTGVQESKVERILKLLKNEQQIEQVGTAKFRVISVINWAMYQSDEQVDEQQMNNKRTANEQQMNTLEECKELQNGKNQHQKHLSPQAGDLLDQAGETKPEKPKPETPPFDWIMARYNEICGHAFKGAATLTDARKKNITKCWSRKVNGKLVFQSGGFWKEYFTWCLRDPHWHGQDGKAWRASLEFVTRPDIVDRVIDEMTLEGVFAHEPA